MASQHQSGAEGLAGNPHSFCPAISQSLLLLPILAHASHLSGSDNGKSITGQHSLRRSLALSMRNLLQNHLRDLSRLRKSSRSHTGLLRGQQTSDNAPLADAMRPSSVWRSLPRWRHVPRLPNPAQVTALFILPCAGTYLNLTDEDTRGPLSCPESASSCGLPSLH